jgi:hypothetical protein
MIIVIVILCRLIRVQKDIQYSIEFSEQLEVKT